MGRIGALTPVAHVTPVVVGRHDGAQRDAAQHRRDPAQGPAGRRHGRAAARRRRDPGDRQRGRRRPRRHRDRLGDADRLPGLRDGCGARGGRGRLALPEPVVPGAAHRRPAALHRPRRDGYRGGRLRGRQPARRAGAAAASRPTSSGWTSRRSRAWTDTPARAPRTCSPRSRARAGVRWRASSTRSASGTSASRRRSTWPTG